MDVTEEEKIEEGLQEEQKDLFHRDTPENVANDDDSSSVRSLSSAELNKFLGVESTIECVDQLVEERRNSVDEQLAKEDSSIPTAGVLVEGNEPPPLSSLNRQAMARSQRQSQQLPVEEQRPGAFRIIGNRNSFVGASSLFGYQSEEGSSNNFTVSSFQRTSRMSVPDVIEGEQDYSQTLARARLVDEQDQVVAMAEELKPTTTEGQEPNVDSEDQKWYQKSVVRLNVFIIFVILFVAAVVLVVVVLRPFATTSNDEPSILPASMAPTQSPSKSPTKSTSPSGTPSMDPSMIPSLSPSFQPSVGIETKISLALIDGVLDSELIEVMGSPQNSALNYIKQERFVAPRAFENGQLYAVFQRYVVATFYYLLPEDAREIAENQFLNSYAGRMIADDCSIPPCSSSFDPYRPMDWLHMPDLGFQNATIPNDLGLITSLTSLQLQNNAFFGTIPKTIGLLSSLEYIDLSNNSITGRIPTEMTNLKNLTYLNLGDTSLLDEGFLVEQLSNLQTFIV